MPRPEKIAEVEILTKKMQDSESVVVSDFTGLTVADVSDLRRKCREAGVEFRVVKNRLARRAAVAADMSGLEPLLKGPSGVAFSFDGPVGAAKVLVEFAEKNDKVAIKGGYLDGAVLSAPEVSQLSKIPGKQELLAMIVRGFQSPLSNFVGVLSATTGSLVRVLDAVAKQKEEAA
jgi:large subunit ribosomal protein L10